MNRIIVMLEPVCLHDVSVRQKKCFVGCKIDVDTYRMLIFLDLLSEDHLTVSCDPVVLESGSSIVPISERGDQAEGASCPHHFVPVPGSEMEIWVSWFCEPVIRCALAAIGARQQNRLAKDTIA